MDESGILEERRGRSNTWPLPDPSEFTKSEVHDVDQPSLKQLSATEGPKKSSRKNAWGNLSYADLITQAIQSSSDQRLTLSQIYDWMVNTVPYFRDKGDSNSSAGWKVSLTLFPHNAIYLFELTSLTADWFSNFTFGVLYVS